MAHSTQESEPENVLIEQMKVKSTKEITCKVAGRKRIAVLVIYEDGGVDVRCELKDYCMYCKYERP